MPISAKTIEERILAITSELRGCGMRLTRQRLEIIREIAATEEHPDVETIYGMVRRRVPAVSLDTVYRTLSVLHECGAVNRMMVATGSARYDPDISRHHHFVCAKCGAVVNVISSERDAFRSSDCASQVGVVERVEVYFRGTCKSCQASNGCQRDDLAVEKERGRS